MRTEERALKKLTYVPKAVMKGQGAQQVVVTLVDHKIDFMELGGCQRGGNMSFFFCT